MDYNAKQAGRVSSILRSPLLRGSLQNFGGYVRNTAGLAAGGVGLAAAADPISGMVHDELDRAQSWVRGIYDTVVPKPAVPAQRDYSTLLNHEDPEIAAMAAELHRRATGGAPGASAAPKTAPAGPQQPRRSFFGHTAPQTNGYDSYSGIFSPKAKATSPAAPEAATPESVPEPPKPETPPVSWGNATPESMVPRVMRQFRGKTAADPPKPSWMDPVVERRSAKRTNVFGTPPAARMFTQPRIVLKHIAPARLMTFADQVHGDDKTTPRGQYAAQAAAYPQPEEARDAAAEDLLKKRWGDLSQYDMTLKIREGGVSRAQPHIPNYSKNRGTVEIAKKQLQDSPALRHQGVSGVVNHELEHLLHQPSSFLSGPIQSPDRPIWPWQTPKGQLKKDWEDPGNPQMRRELEYPADAMHWQMGLEVGPSIGDTVFSAERDRQLGVPIQNLSVDYRTYPNLSPGAADGTNMRWAVEQARQHGYFDGRPMTDLLFRTPEGRQWLQQQSGAGPAYLPSYKFDDSDPNKADAEAWKNKRAAGPSPVSRPKVQDSIDSAYIDPWAARPTLREGRLNARLANRLPDMGSRGETASVLEPLFGVPKEHVRLPYVPRDDFEKGLKPIFSPTGIHSGRNSYIEREKFDEDYRGLMPEFDTPAIKDMRHVAGHDLLRGRWGDMTKLPVSWLTESPSSDRSQTGSREVYPQRVSGYTQNERLLMALHPGFQPNLDRVGTDDPGGWTSLLRKRRDLRQLDSAKINRDLERTLTQPHPIISGPQPLYDRNLNLVFLGTPDPKDPWDKGSKPGWMEGVPPNSMQFSPIGEEEWYLGRHIGPQVGDVAFKAERDRRIGIPVGQVNADLIDGHLTRSQDGTEGNGTNLKWVAEQARQHGYFDGRPMEDLLFRTPEGRQWLRQQKFRTDEAYIPRYPFAPDDPYKQYAEAWKNKRAAGPSPVSHPEAQNFAENVNLAADSQRARWEPDRAYTAGSRLANQLPDMGSRGNTEPALGSLFGVPRGNGIPSRGTRSDEAKELIPTSTATGHHFSRVPHVYWKDFSESYGNLMPEFNTPAIKDMRQVAGQDLLRGRWGDITKLPVSWLTEADSLRHFGQQRNAGYTPAEHMLMALHPGFRPNLDRVGTDDPGGWTAMLRERHDPWQFNAPAVNRGLEQTLTQPHPVISGPLELDRFAKPHRFMGLSNSKDPWDKNIKLNWVEPIEPNSTALARVGRHDWERAHTLGPQVGHMVFTAERDRRIGIPVEQLKADLIDGHLTRSPDGTEGNGTNMRWAAEQARQHGYFDGRPMTDLLQRTPEGRQWLQQQKYHTDEAQIARYPFAPDDPYKQYAEAWKNKKSRAPGFFV